MKYIVRSLFLITILASNAQASLIQNSGFDDCADPLASFCLDQYEVFATESNSSGDESFVVIDSPANPGVFFNAGRLTPPNIFTDTTPQGGGIRQSFNFSGGDLNIDVFYNTLFNSGGTSTRGSIQATLFGPGSATALLSDVFDFFLTDLSDTGAQGSLNLSSTSDLLAGLYTLQVSFTRGFQIGQDVSFGLTGVSATSQTGGLAGAPSDIPEPATLAMLFIALIGLVVMRKHSAKKQTVS
jgi:hypothetical protein